MSLSIAQTFLNQARHQHSQLDINDSLMRVIGELLAEVKKLDDEVHSLRHSMQVARRFE
jgi:hypothetical protein